MTVSQPVHSPAPWSTRYDECIQLDGKKYYAQQVYDSEGDRVATVDWTLHPADKQNVRKSTNREANAELIAKAPQMAEEIRAKQWQPIETAPNNIQILLYGKGCGICLGLIYESAGPGSATHWMPLPEKPESDQ